MKTTFLTMLIELTLLVALSILLITTTFMATSIYKDVIGWHEQATVTQLHNLELKAQKEKLEAKAAREKEEAFWLSHYVICLAQNEKEPNKVPICDFSVRVGYIMGAHTKEPPEEWNFERIIGSQEASK